MCINDHVGKHYYSSSSMLRNWDEFCRLTKALMLYTVLLLDVKYIYNIECSTT